MNNSYVINADIKFRLNSASTKPVVDSLTKQLGTRGVNLPVNLQFKGVNVKDITRQNTAFRQLTNTITSLGTSSSKSAKQLNSLYNSIRHVGSSLTNFGSNRGLQVFNSNVHKATQHLQGLGKTTNQIKHNMIGFSESVGISARRFLSFGVAAAVLAKTSYEVRNATVAALEFDHEMVKLKQVSGDSNTVLASIAKTISKLGIDMGVSSSEMAKTAVTLRQAGLSAMETKKALEVLGKTTLSPTFEDLHSTTEGLIALFNQFDKNINNLESHFSSISKVSADFAVESSDLVEALKRTGGAFRAAGGNVNELLAMYTTIRQTTRESAESIATGMRTIIARLQDPVIARKLHDIGVEVYDLKGQFVGPYEAVERLGAALRKLPSGDIRASQVLKDIGGLRQLSRVIPLIYNNDITTRALQSANGGGTKLADDAKVAQEAVLVQLSRIKEGFLDLFRVITTDSSVRTVLKGIASSIELVAESLRTLKPLIPVLLAFTAFKGITSAVSGYQSFKRGLFAPARGYADGGFVTGGTPGKDSVPARLMPGEFVMSKRAVDRIGKNNIENLHHMARGGTVIPRDQTSARERLSYILANREHRKAIYEHIKGSTYLGKGAEALAFQNKSGNVVRIGSSETVRPAEGGLTLQPIKSKVVGRKLIEELPYAPPISKTFDENKNNRILRLYSRKVRRSGYIPWDVHEDNISVYKGKIVAIDPNVYAKTKDILGVSSFTSGSVKIKAYAGGGTVGFSLRELFKGKERGTDTVPAMLTPGEFVVNRQAAQDFGYENLQAINRRQYRMNRRRNRYGVESLYGYDRLAEHLEHAQLAHAKKTYQLQGNYRFATSPNFFQQRTLGFKKHLRSILNEHIYKGIVPPREPKQFIWRHNSLGVVSRIPNPNISFPLNNNIDITKDHVNMSSGGDVTRTHIYMSVGGEVPFGSGKKKRVKSKNIYTPQEKGNIPISRNSATGDIPIGGANIGPPKRNRGYTLAGGAGERGEIPSGQNIITPNPTPYFYPFHDPNMKPMLVSRPSDPLPPTYLPPPNKWEDPKFVEEQQRLVQQYRKKSITFGGTTQHQGATQNYLQQKSRLARESITFNSPLTRQGSSKEYIKKKALTNQVRNTSTSQSRDNSEHYYDALDMATRIRDRIQATNLSQKVENYNESQGYRSAEVINAAITQHRDSIPTQKLPKSNIRYGFAAKSKNSGDLLLQQAIGNRGRQTKPIANASYLATQPSTFPLVPSSPAADQDRVGRLPSPHLNVLNQVPIDYQKPKEFLASVGRQRLVNQDSRRDYLIQQKRKARLQREEAESHFGNGMSDGYKGSSNQIYGPKRLYEFTSVDRSGRHVGALTIKATSENGAKKILAMQDKFVTSIKRVDNTLTKRLFPTLSKFIDNTTKDANGIVKKGGLLNKLKGNSGFGLLAASIAVPMASEALLGDAKNPGVAGKGGVVAGGTLTGAVTGASFGSMFGPWGTAIGGLIGATVGATGALNEFAEETKEVNFKKIVDDLNSVQFHPQIGTFSKTDRSRFGNAISKSIDQGLVEQDTYTNRAYREASLKNVAQAVINPGGNIQRFFSEKYEGERGKYKDLESIPEQERNTISDAIKKAFMSSSEQNPNLSYQDIQKQLGKFKVGQNEYGAGEVLGLNFKNVEEVNRFIESQQKAAATQNRLNDIMNQTSRQYELTIRELESFTNALEASEEQFATRQHYSEMEEAPLRGQVMAAPNRITLGNMGGPNLLGKNPVSYDIHEFSKQGGGYDTARQELLKIIDQVKNQDLTKINPEDAKQGIDTRIGTQGSLAFEKSSAGGAYNKQIASRIEYIFGKTQNFKEKAEASPESIVDEILAPYKQIKDSGQKNNQTLQKAFGQRQQDYIKNLDRQLELDQQGSHLRSAEIQNLAANGPSLSTNARAVASFPSRLSGRSQGRVQNINEKLSRGEKLSRSEGSFLRRNNVAVRGTTAEERLGGVAGVELRNRTETKTSYGPFSVPGTLGGRSRQRLKDIIHNNRFGMTLSNQNQNFLDNNGIYQKTYTRGITPEEQKENIEYKAKIKSLRQSQNKLIGDAPDSYRGLSTYSLRERYDQQQAQSAELKSQFESAAQGPKGEDLKRANVLKTKIEAGLQGRNINEVKDQGLKTQIQGFQKELDNIFKNSNVSHLDELRKKMNDVDDATRRTVMAMKNLAEDVTAVEHAEKQYAMALNEHRADQESRKKDADVLAFGSQNDKMQLMMKENITQQALGLNGQQFSNLPEEIKKIVFERLNETQGMVRSVPVYDKYMRQRGVRDIKSGEALDNLRQPYLDVLKSSPAAQRLADRVEETSRGRFIANADKNEAGIQFNKINQKNISKSAVQGEDSYQKFLAGINQSIAQQMEATSKFLSQSAELTKALNSFNGKLTIERNGRIEILLNGGQFLQAMKGDLEKEVLNTVIEQLKVEVAKQVRNQPAR